MVVQPNPCYHGPGNIRYKERHKATKIVNYKMSFFLLSLNKQNSGSKLRGRYSVLKQKKINLLGQAPLFFYFLLHFADQFFQVVR